MARINFDFDSIQRTVIPAIEGSCDNINHAKRAIGNVYVPSDCAYRSYLYGLGNKLSNVQNKLNRVSSWVRSTNSSLEESLNDISSDISTIQVVKVPKK